MVGCILIVLLDDNSKHYARGGRILADCSAFIRQHLPRAYLQGETMKALGTIAYAFAWLGNPLRGLAGLFMLIALISQITEYRKEGKR